MRVVHYSSSISQSAGGMFYSVSGLARAQQALGADVTVVGGADPTFAQDQSNWGDLPLETFPIRGVGAYTFLPRIARLLLRMKPDILHIHGIWSETGVYGRIASLAGIATVCSPRGMLDPWILRRSALVKRVHGTLFERPFLRRSLINALNLSEREAVLAFFAPEPVRVFVAPNGVHLPTTAPGTDRDGALYIGRLHEKKQVLELVDHWTQTDALQGVPLTIAGWGKAPYEAEVARRCAAAANVTFVGRAYGEAKAALLDRAAWFILPSLSEGLPMAVLEAMAAGCIPIITRECNLPELTDAGSAVSLQSDFSDFSAVAARIAGSTAAQREALQARALQDVKAYSWPSIARQVLDEYRAFLDARGR